MVRAAGSIRFVCENRLVTTINLTGLATRQYEIETRDGVESILALHAFEVTDQPPKEAGAFNFVKTIAVIEIKGTISRTWRNQRINFGEYNDSDSPLATPLYLLRATNVQPEQKLQGALGSVTVRHGCCRDATGLPMCRATPISPRWAATSPRARTTCSRSSPRPMGEPQGFAAPVGGALMAPRFGADHSAAGRFSKSIPKLGILCGSSAFTSNCCTGGRWEIEFEA